MLARTPDPLDVMVGAKIRIFRTHCGMSQSDLAGKIGVTFQQVQKYEKGINRVGASRLSRIAAVLDVSVGELFECSENSAAGDKAFKDKRADLRSPFRLLAERDALRVLKAFSRISDPVVRRTVARLIEAVADQLPVAKSSIAHSVTALRRERRRRISATPS